MRRPAPRFAEKKEKEKEKERKREPCKPPPIEISNPEERRAFVLEAWKCLHDCEACGKCHILKGKDPEQLYADYIEGKRSYREITLEWRNAHY